MLAHGVKRLLATIPVLLSTSITVFVLMHLRPGDPLTLLLGETQSDMSAAAMAALRHQYGARPADLGCNT